LQIKIKDEQEEHLKTRNKLKEHYNKQKTF